MARLDQRAGDRLPHAAAEVEHRPAGRHQRPETVEPWPLEQLAPALRVPRGRMALVEADDPVGVVAHPSLRYRKQHPACYPRSMTRVEDIERAVAELPRQDLAAFPAF